MDLKKLGTSPKSLANMTHSSRRSYKDKYLAAKAEADLPDVREEAEALSQLAELQSVTEHERAKLHSILQEVAILTSDFVALLDTRDGQMQFQVKDVRKPIDSNLMSMDSALIARRTRDVMRHAYDRLGMASMGMKDLRESVAELKTGIRLLQPSTRKLQSGYLESFVVGKNPTDKEIQEAEEVRGKNPRTLAYQYETDDSDSENETASTNASALVPTSPSRIVKPPGRTPASRRVKDSAAIDIY